MSTTATEKHYVRNETITTNVFKQQIVRANLWDCLDVYVKEQFLRKFYYFFEG